MIFQHIDAINLSALSKDLGKGLKKIGKKNPSVSFARPHRLDRELQFSKLQDKARHLLSGGTHLAVNS